MRQSLLIFFTLILIPLSGCRSDIANGPIAVVEKVPVIELPPRPKLERLTAEELAEYQKLPESARKKLEENNQKLMIYADQAVESIKEFNGYAKFTNQRSEKWVKGGMKAEVVPAPADGK